MAPKHIHAHTIFTSNRELLLHLTTEFLSQKSIDLGHYQPDALCILYSRVRRMAEGLDFNIHWQEKEDEAKVVEWKGRS
jgi:hypothetical protein